MRLLLSHLLALSVAVLPSLAAQAQSRPTVPQGRLADIAAFRKYVLSADRSYSPSARAEAQQRLARLADRVGEVSPTYFELELARITALADNGHTNSAAQFRSPRYSRVPIRLVPFGEHFHVLRADTANADLLGGRLVAIDGHSVVELRRAAHTLWGGTPAYRDRSVPFFLESPDQLKALDLALTEGDATYELEFPDGKRITRKLVADPPNPTRERYGTSRWLSPEPLDADRGDWKAVGPPSLPWAFHEPTVPFRWRRADDLDAFVIQLRANRDVEGHSIAAFLAEVTAAIRQARPRHIILDLRADGGGDLNTTRDFAGRLPALVPGRIFVLTSPWTFSAGISTVGYLKQAGGARVSIVGEMVGDRPEFWAEGGFVRLEYSGAGMSLATERHDYKTGCAPYTDCHGPVVRHPIRVASFAPDIVAPLTIEAYLAGHDPGMDAITQAR